MSKVFSLPVLHCLRCRHQWVPRRAEIPTRCPKCKSPYWQRERVEKKK